MPRGGTPEAEIGPFPSSELPEIPLSKVCPKGVKSPRGTGGCEKIRNLWETRREGTPPPMIRKELRALLEARCPHRANFFTAPRLEREFNRVYAANKPQERPFHQVERTLRERAFSAVGP